MRARAGFTLVELLVALTLLAVVFMSLSGSAAQYAHNVGQNSQRATAMQLAADRIEEVRMHPRYGELKRRFDGTEFGVDGMEDVVRTTVVRPQADTTRTGVVDYTIVTVEVDRPGLVQPVARTIIVGAP